MGLDDAENKIIDLLLIAKTEEKKGWLAEILNIIGEHDRLAEKVVELVRTLSQYEEKHVTCAAEQPDKIPMGDIYIQDVSLSNDIEESSTITKKLAKLLTPDSFDTESVRVNCCKLVQNTCEVENDAVTTGAWESSDNQNPGGIIGYTYSELLQYNTAYAKGFRNAFISGSNELFNRAKTLYEDVEEHPENIENYLEQAYNLLRNSSDLMQKAIAFFGSS